MESTAQLDELGHPQVLYVTGLRSTQYILSLLSHSPPPQEGSTHHLITLVKDGPVGQHGELQAGDEILQVCVCVFVHAVVVGRSVVQ